MHRTTTTPRKLLVAAPAALVCALAGNALPAAPATRGATVGQDVVHVAPVVAPARRPVMPPPRAAPGTPTASPLCDGRGRLLPGNVPGKTLARPSKSGEPVADKPTSGPT